MMKALALIVILLGIPAAVFADAVDDFLQSQMQRHGIPGISLAICRDGQVVRATGYGLANVELDVPVKPETVFQTGSIGTQFTAMAVMMLVDEGRLGLDDPINRYFPGAPATWKAITVRHLLTHTSGIKDWEGKTDLDYRKDYTEDELVQVAMKLPPDFAPVTQWSYSNTGYVLLGILVHKVSGKFYGDFLTAGVGLPLAQHHRRRLALHHDPRHGDVGRRPLGTTLPQAGELPGNVVTREAAGQHHLSLRVRVGVRRAAARAGDQAHRFLAGVQDGDRSLPRPQAHRDRPGQPRPGRAGAPGHRGCRPRGARAKAGREDLQNQLATATGFTFLAEDDEKGRGLELRGEPISSVAFCFMPGQRDRRYRFFLNDNGEVADFSSEIVD